MNQYRTNNQRRLINVTRKRLRLMDRSTVTKKMMKKERRRREEEDEDSFYSFLISNIV